ncbi:tetratricopeptide repeat protein [Aquiflexum sp.]|uniref:tetratricopeptide repeat protein n=1 Tax=Aquiflexum sp. TaxID=1872584 RepID=UPI0035935308
MKTHVISHSLKMFFIILATFMFTLHAQGQHKDGKQAPLKGLGSKLKEKTIPAVLGPKGSGEKNNNSKEKQSESEEGKGEIDPEEVKFDEDEDDPDKMMEKMIRNLGHDPENIQRMADKAGPDVDMRTIPEPDLKVVAGIKPTPPSESELLNYLKAFDNGADQALSDKAREQVLPHLNKGKETKGAGYMLWLTGQQEASSYLMLKAAIADLKDELLLSNLASVITMAGYADKSIPILEYLKSKNPQSSIVNNNLGQAWLSLGRIDKAKPLLLQAVSEYDQHPEANRSLARISQKEGSTAQAKTYLENALKGGFSQESYFELRDLTGSRSDGMIESIKINHKRYLKEIAITKRFTMPSVPVSLEAAITREGEIEDFFQGIKLTNEDIFRRVPPSEDKLFLNHQKVTGQMAANNRNMTSMEDVQKQYSLAAQIWNPFKIQAQEVLMAELDDSYASSFNKRINKLIQSREGQMKALEEAFAVDYRKLEEMEKRLSKMETGEGESPEVQTLERQICLLRKKLFELSVEKSADINNAFVHEMESLAFQQLQEQTYWYTLYHLPQDPTGLAYRLYADYLKTLSGLKAYYPYPVPPLYTGNGCEVKLPDLITANGKMTKWEDTHCITHWDLDLHFVKSKFTCREATIGAKVYGVEFGGGQKYDPSTLETVEHSVYFGGKIGKRNEDVGKALSVQAGAGLVTTIKFDGNWDIKDIVVKGTIGAELGLKVPKSTDPNDSGLDIRQAASIGISESYEISIVSGFKGAGSKVSTVGNIFNRL